MRTIAAVLCISLTGCQTAQSYGEYASAMARIAEANASVAREQANAMERLAQFGNSETTRTVAVIMLAMGAQNNRQPVNVAPPINEGLEWARVLAGPITAGFLGYFGYRQAVHLSNNNADVSIAGYGAMSNIAGAGFNAVGQFKPAPIDWSTFPVTTRTETNTTIGVTNRDGLVVLGGDGAQDNSNRPIAIVPPVVIVPGAP